MAKRAAPPQWSAFLNTLLSNSQQWNAFINARPNNSRARDAQARVQKCSPLLRRRPFLFRKLRAPRVDRRAR
eukprot:5628051-Lingulodinium_polyedra.AAC.1